MPANSAVLSSLIQANLSTGFQSISGTNPLSQPDPSKFIAFCVALGTGIAQGIPSLRVKTTDTGFSGGPPPGKPNVIPGAGTGKGLSTDAGDMTSRIYQECYRLIKARIPDTKVDAWPPPPGNTGEYLKAISKGVADAVKTHYASCWAIVTMHPDIYAGVGVIGPGDVSGADPGAVKSAMVAADPDTGTAYPDICEGVAKGVCASIAAKATGNVTVVGVCVPSASPPFLCGIPNTGSGSGTAT